MSDRAVGLGASMSSTRKGRGAKRYPSSFWSDAHSRFKRAADGDRAARSPAEAVNLSCVQAPSDVFAGFRSLFT